MDKPNLNYIVIGSPKCGTTSFCDLLGQHPEVFMTNPKEPGFFSQGRFLKTLDWDWYSSLFTGVKDEKAIGEGTVNYTCCEYRRLADPEIIYNYYPNAKLIYMVRNPIERIQSEWLSCAIMGKSYNLGEFNKAIYSFPGFINTSRYWSNINRFRRFFSDQQIHVVFFEDFIKEPQLEMTKVFHFLNVDSNYEVKDAYTPKNQSIKNYIDSPLMVQVRQLKGFKNLKSLIPEFLRPYLIPILKKKNTGHPDWQSETLDWVINELKYDTLSFLEWCDKPGDFWKF